LIGFRQRDARLARPTGRRGSCRALAERQHPKGAMRRASASQSHSLKKEKRRRQTRLRYARR